MLTHHYTFEIIYCVILKEILHLIIVFKKNVLECSRKVYDECKARSEDTNSVRSKNGHLFADRLSPDVLRYNHLGAASNGKRVNEGGSLW